MFTVLCVLAALALPAVWCDARVGICLVVKDEHIDIEEWLDYHAYIGVDTVYLYDDQSTPPMKDILGPYIASGYVVYHHTRGEKGLGINYKSSVQYNAQNDCLTSYRDDNDWLAFIDSDEYIVVHDDFPSLKNFLARYTDVPVVYINWILFAPGDIQERKTVGEGVLRTYDKCLPLDHVKNRAVKPIGNCKYVVEISDPHNVLYNKSLSPGVNGNGDLAMPDDAYIKNPDHDSIALYHYMFKSVEHAHLKFQKSASGVYKTPTYFNRIQEAATERCTFLKNKVDKCCPLKMKYDMS